MIEALDKIKVELENVAAAVCDDLCKWPGYFLVMAETKKLPHDELAEALYEQKCRNCPVQKLL